MVIRKAPGWEDIVRATYEARQSFRVVPWPDPMPTIWKWAGRARFGSGPPYAPPEFGEALMRASAEGWTDPQLATILGITANDVHQHRLRRGYRAR